VATQTEGTPLILKPTIGHDSEPVSSTSHPCNQSYVILPSPPWSTKWTFLKRLHHQNNVFSVSPIVATYPAHHSLKGFSIMTVLCELYKSYSSLLCNIQNCSHTSSFLDSNIFLSILILNELYLCFPGFNSCEVCSGWVICCHRCLTCFKGLFCVCTQVSGPVVSDWPLCEFWTCVLWFFGIYIFIPQFFFRHQTMDKVQKYNSFKRQPP
jgi:hypothetical protein